MNRIPVISTNLKSVGYNSADCILEIEFISGSVYQYYDVPAEVHSELMSASSHGKYFAANIRNNDKYGCEEI